MGADLRPGGCGVNRLTPIRKIGPYTFEMPGYFIETGSPLVRGGLSFREGVPAEPTMWLQLGTGRLRLSVREVNPPPATSLFIAPDRPAFEFWGSDLRELILDGARLDARRFPIRIEGGEVRHIQGYVAVDNGGAATQPITECISRTTVSPAEVRIEIEGYLATEGITDLGDAGGRYIVPYFNIVILVPMELALVETRLSPALLQIAADAAGPA